MILIIVDSRWFGPQELSIICNSIELVLNRLFHSLAISIFVSKNELLNKVDNNSELLIILNLLSLNHHSSLECANYVAHKLRQTSLQVIS